MSILGVEEMLAEHGIEVSYEAMRRWELKLDPAYVANIRPSHPRPSATQHVVIVNELSR